MTLSAGLQSFHEKSADNLMSFLLYVTSCFSLVVLNILTLILVILIVKCHGMVLFEFILFVTCFLDFFFPVLEKF